MHTFLLIPKVQKQKKKGNYISVKATEIAKILHQNKLTYSGSRMIRACTVL